MINIENEASWNTYLTSSGETPVLVFKHSTTCPVSARAKSEVSRYENERKDGSVPIVFVNVIEQRPISNQIAADLDVTHASPQLILVVNSAAVWTTSHGNITAGAIQQAVQDHLM